MSEERKKGWNFVVIAAILVLGGMGLYLPSTSPLELYFFPLVAVIGGIILIYGLYLVFSTKNVKIG
jgi:hypothetical protein